MFFWNHKKRLSHLNSFVRSDREISELVPQSPSPIIVNVGSSPVGSITPRTACQLEAAHVTIFSCIQRMKLYFKSKYVVFLKFRHCCFFTKFWGADFKYDNIVFKFRPKNTQIMHFWSQI